MKKPKRYILMSVPTEDSAFWFAFDTQARRSVECDNLEAAREVCNLVNVYRITHGKNTQMRRVRQRSGSASSGSC